MRIPIPASTQSPAIKLVAAMKHIYRQGLTTTSGGNISVKDTEGNIWITPSGTDKGELQASDIVCVTPGGIVEGTHLPSSEYPFHLAIYACRPDIAAIVHAHPSALVAFSITSKTPDINIAFSNKHICGSIGVASYAIPGSQLLGKQVSKVFQKGHSCVIMENHGAVVGGKTLAEALQRFEALEASALFQILAKTLGKIKTLTNQQVREYEMSLNQPIPEISLDIHPWGVHRKRAEIIKFIRRAYEQRLITACNGTFSLRLADDNFLITAAGVSLADINKNDLVLVADGKREPGKLPDPLCLLHREIYRRNPGIHAIIQSQPPHLMAFGITHTPFDVRTIPENLIFLENVSHIPFHADFNQQCERIGEACAGSSALILQHDTVLVSGKNMLQAYDRLEIAESGAKSLIMSKSIGKFRRLSDARVEEIRLTQIQH